MRSLLLLSIVALAACDDAQSTTAPANARAIPTPSAQASADAPTGQAKPLQQGGFTTVTVVTSNEFVNPGGGVAGSVACPAGTTRISGGYAFTNEGNWSVLPAVTQNVPLANGWFVRTVNTGAVGVAFKVYVLCAS
jgi:hypothetical protein